MIARDLSTKIKSLYTKFPVLFITGPRQSGKTTLLQFLFPKLPYVTLEDPDIMQLAINDARSFLQQFPKGVIIDEAQRVPQLFSYIQAIVDKDKKAKFILSGSQNFLLSKQISQSLAGRTGVLSLLPLSINELKKAKIKSTAWTEMAWKGFYPRLYDKKIKPLDFYSSYVRTYVERDVRLALNIIDLRAFNTFLKICAGRAGQMVNYAQMANDIGVSPNTVKGWISLLTSSYIVFELQPYFNSFNKRLVKSTKLYFHDTGLLCYLLGIQNHKEINTHPFKGAIFENLIISELYKTKLNKGAEPNLYWWRDKTGNEIDCIILNAYNKIEAIETKAGSTFHQDFFKGLNYFSEISKLPTKHKHLIYAGSNTLVTKSGNIHSVEDLATLYKIIK
jgi:uncharacterized protein